MRRHVQVDVRLTAPPRPAWCASPHGGPTVAGRHGADVGADEDSGHRRRATIEAFAAGADYLLIGGHHDAAVSGADPVERCPSLAVVLDRVDADRVRGAPVENASRFARSLMGRKLACY